MADFLMTKTDKQRKCKCLPLKKGGIFVSNKKHLLKNKLIFRVEKFINIVYNIIEI